MKVTAKQSIRYPMALERLYAKELTDTFLKCVG